MPETAPGCDRPKPWHGRSANLVAHRRVFGGFVGMGAKYYPTVKDQKANQRFLQKQRAQVKPKKVPAVKPEPKDEKK